MTKIKRKIVKSYEGDIIRLVLLATALPSALLFYFVISAGISIYLKILIILFVVIVTGYSCFSIWQKITYQLRTSINIIESVIFGDGTTRPVSRYKQGALAEFNHTLTGLSSAISTHKQELKEQQLLLTKIINQIDVAIITTDHNNAIVLMNPSAEKLFACRFEAVIGGPINQLGLQDALNVDGQKVVEFQLKQHRKKVYLHVDKYLVNTQTHNLIFITDIQQLLREEERIAWQRLVRVLSHEINNSLAPIASISESLAKLTRADLTQADNKADLHQGLCVISERAHSLNTFIKSYQQLSTLPPPVKSLMSVADFIHSTTALYPQINWQLPKSPDISFFVDCQQLQQALVNLITNAIEASNTNQSASNKEPISLTLQWKISEGKLLIQLLDSGVGIANIDNLFVPFYTTKTQGSGIGLVLSRQIAMNHDGDLHIENRDTQRGVQATIVLPTR
ncbi:sensor histidine kinase [Pseudoalteromonas sp. Ld20]|uniref:sensor histidine kinase n=1 Tax=Pseudoalteromonas sp. Ld20 TaxID=649165 RepID=UPI00386B2AD6